MNIWCTFFLFFSLPVFAADSEPVTKVKMTGGDETYTADVVLEGGERKLKVSADVEITTQTAQARDLFPDSWCEITGTGGIGDTVEINIPDDSCQVSVATAAPEVGDVVALAEKLRIAFAADGTCNPLYDISRVEDNSVLVVAAKTINGIAERPDSGDFQCNVTGSATMITGFDNLISRQKLIKCVPDTDDPRTCATNVSGNISIEESTVGNRIADFLKNGAATDMRVNGSGTPVNFRFPADPTNLVFVTQVRCFGGGNGIKFGQFLSKSGGPLTNGVLLTIRSEGSDTLFRVIKTTEDWKNIFTFPDPGGFRLDIQAGGDQFIAVFRPAVPFEINPVGGNSPAADDYIEIKIQDNLSSGLTSFECSMAGFIK